VVLALIVCKIFLPGVPFNFVGIMCYLVTYQKISHLHQSQSLPFDSVSCNADSGGIIARTSVCSWGWPNSSRESQTLIPSLQFRKRAASSALVAKATTKRRMVHNVKNAPFNLIGSPSLGDHPMKKWPHAQLCAFISER
jgi:hypothetical protein